ncbi:MAG: TOBE domain-containing protein [Actinobacteria bacterium]|nr:TOBE domain-containing protein [Actinomycetota bacterium]
MVIEDLGERVRIEVGEPLPLIAEVTPAAVADLGLTPGSPVWVSVKATEITVSES